MNTEPCNVVLDNDCTAPPGYEDSYARTSCYACGLAVCASCSTIRKYMGSKHRICANCEQQIFDDGEARVLLRLYRRAGYPNVRLAQTRAWI